MIDKVDGNRIGNDINKHLIALLVALQNGYVPPFITREEYNMPGGKDYVPKRDAQLDEWGRNYTTEIPAIIAALGLPATWDDVVIAAFADWQLAYIAHQTAQNAAHAATETKRLYTFCLFWLCFLD